VYLWELRSGFEFEARLRHEAAVYGLVFTPDSLLLVSAGADATLKYWDLPAVVEGEARRQLRRQPAECTALAISREGGSLISGHINRSLRVHDTATGRLVASLHGHRSAPSALAVSHQDDLLLSGSRNGTVRLFRFDTKAQLRSFSGHGKTVSSVAFLPDGRHFASVAMDHFLLIWSLSESEPVASLAAHGEESLAAVACLARSRRLVCGLSDGRFRLWSY
jgi:WD40 repeat protein